jgi:hypothetical protein
MKVMLPIFSENVITITMKFTWVIHTSCNYDMRLLLHSLHNFQHTFANAVQDVVH